VLDIQAAVGGAGYGENNEVIRIQSRYLILSVLLQQGYLAIFRSRKFY
jgi:hypothetical protein